MITKSKGLEKELWTIEAAGQKAMILPEVGGELIELCIDGIEVFHKVESLEAVKAECTSYGLPILFPPNRIDGGHFTFAGKEYQFEVNEPATGNSLHGFLHKEPWEIEALQDMDFDPMLTGFDEVELKELFGSADDGDVEEDDFDLNAALEKASFVEHGDIWTVGRHRLMCGDATNAEDVETLMDGKTANLILTDPPYGVSFKSETGLTLQNDSIKGDDFYQFLLSAFTNMKAHLQKGGGIYCFHADTEGLTFRRAFIDAGFHLSGVCIWVKNSLVPGYSDYQWRHEPILYGYQEGARHRWYSDRKQTTVWNFDKQTTGHHHPTSKPLDLLSYPIGNSTQENGIVIDTFGGSGSTLMACEAMNRICYMMELDEKYASVILRRYVEDTGEADNVWCEREGQRVMYADVVKEVEGRE